MKIGIVTAWGPRGASYVSRLYENVLSPTHDVFIYARATTGELRGNKEWDRPNVWWGKDIVSPFSVTMFARADFLRWIKTNGIEAVIFNEQHWWPPVRWCREMGVRTIAYVDYYTEQTLPLFRYYDALICNTRRHFEAFSWHTGAKYIPWGTDISTFRPLAEIALVEPARTTFFHSCGVSPMRKGTDALIRAFSRAKTTGKLVLHSQVPLAEKLPALAATLRDLVSQGRLKIIEGTHEGAGLFSTGDVYLYPSVLEGIGLTIAEAIASGLVPVVTDEPPMSEFVRPEFGYLIPVARRHARMDGYYWPKARVDEDALVHIIESLDANPAQILSMKKVARAFAVASLDWTKNASALPAMLAALPPPLPPDGGWADLEAFERWGGRKLNPLFVKLAPLAGPLLRFFRRTL